MTLQYEVTLGAMGGVVCTTLSLLGGPATTTPDASSLALSRARLALLAVVCYNPGMIPSKRRSGPVRAAGGAAGRNAGTMGRHGGVHPQRAAVANALMTAHHRLTQPSLMQHPLSEGEKSALMGTAQTLTSQAAAPAE